MKIRNWTFRLALTKEVNIEVGIFGIRSTFIAECNCED